MANEKTLYDIWSNLSKDLEKLKQEGEKKSQWGYNNLYSRSFVNKLNSLQDEFNDSITIELFLTLLQEKETGYLTITLIKCFLVLKPRFDDRFFMEELRKKLIKKIDDYEKYLNNPILESHKMRFRGLKSLLVSCRSEM